MIRRFRMTIILSSVAILASACGSAGGDSNSTVIPQAIKPVWSSWHSAAESFDLTMFEYDLKTRTVDIQFADNSVCQTTLTQSGGPTIGTISMASTTYVGGGSGDPGCASWNGNYTYQISDGYTLLLCNSSSVCASYY